MPSTGALVKEAIGNTRAAAMDVAAACSGLVYAYSVADAYLRSGMFKNALVVGSETLSRYLDFSDRGTCILFGDGAAAMVLSATADERYGLLSFDLGVDGSAAGLLEVPAGGSRRPTTAQTVADGEHYLKRAGPEVFRRAVRIVVDSATIALERAGVTVDELAWFAPHQANVRIIDAAAQRLAIAPERTLVNIDRFGNTSAASIPLVLAEAADDGRLREGDLVLLSGFGAGLTWGSAVLRWGRE
jgi:3-oxoacyl-[acyl-carrier-protein] synthase-3